MNKKEKKKIIIFGANSAIAQASARAFCNRYETTFCLVARNSKKLEITASDLRIRGASEVKEIVVDLDQVAHHQDLIRNASIFMGGIDIALIAQGTLGDQKEAQQNFDVTEKLLRNNLLGPISLLTILANEMQTQGHGVIAVISSVAGDRGRASNYVYGCAKGGLSIFLSGLRNRLAKMGIQVLTIKPGFVDSPMTREFKKGPLWASPEAVGNGIARAIENKKDVAYLPGFWRLIMTIILLIPERVFKKLSL